MRHNDFSNEHGPASLQSRHHAFVTDFRKRNLCSRIPEFCNWKVIIVIAKQKGPKHGVTNFTLIYTFSAFFYILGTLFVRHMRIQPVPRILLNVFSLLSKVGHWLYSVWRLYVIFCCHFSYTSYGVPIPISQFLMGRNLDYSKCFRVSPPWSV